MTLYSCRCRSCLAGFLATYLALEREPRCIFCGSTDFLRYAA